MFSKKNTSPSGALVLQQWYLACVSSQSWRNAILLSSFQIYQLYPSICWSLPQQNPTPSVKMQNFHISASDFKCHPKQGATPVDYHNTLRQGWLNRAYRHRMLLVDDIINMLKHKGFVGIVMVIVKFWNSLQSRTKLFSYFTNLKTRMWVVIIAIVIRASKTHMRPLWVRVWYIFIDFNHRLSSVSYFDELVFHVLVRFSLKELNYKVGFFSWIKRLLSMPVAGYRRSRLVRDSKRPF